MKSQRNIKILIIAAAIIAIMLPSLPMDVYAADVINADGNDQTVNKQDPEAQGAPEAAESELLNEEKDKTAAANVDELIKKIGKVTYGKANKIKAARAAYKELTKTQKNNIHHYGLLTKAEKCYKKINDFKCSKIKIKVKKFKKINVRVRWNKIKQAKKYIVYRRSGGRWKMAKITNRRSFVDKNKIRRKYAYKVKAYANITGRGYYSRYSNTKHIKIAAKKVKVKAYAYCQIGGICANGMRCKTGRIASDPRYIPTGTWLYVPGYGLCQACDTGGNIKGYTIDLFMNSNGACNRWGVRYPTVYILK